MDHAIESGVHQRHFARSRIWIFETRRHCCLWIFVARGMVCNSLVAIAPTRGGARAGADGIWLSTRVHGYRDLRFVGWRVAARLEINQRRIVETIHGVTISRSYYLGAHEVTQEEYKKDSIESG